MNHRSTFEIDLPTIVVLISAIITLCLQLWLCRKAKSVFVKLLPIVLLTLSTIAFFVCAEYASGWDAFGYLFFALLSFGLLLVCGIGWGIWAIIRKTNT